MKNLTLEDLTLEEQILIDGGWRNPFGHLPGIIDFVQSLASGFIEGFIDGGEAVIEANQ